MTCGVFAFFGTVLNLLVLFRILFGPFGYFGVVAFHYGIRICTVSFMTMLSFKIIVQTLFVIDFDHMASMGETGMMTALGAFTTTFTVVHVVMESILRNHRGLQHYPRWCASVYISKVCLI